MNALVLHHRPLRQNRGQDPYHLSALSGLDRLQRLGSGRAGRGGRGGDLSHPPVRLRGAARVRPYSDRAPLRDRVAGSDPPADRRGREHAAHAGGSAPGTRGGARRTGGQSRDRPRAFGCRRLVAPERPRPDRQHASVARRAARGGQHLSCRLQPDSRFSDGWRAGASCAARDAHGQCGGHGGGREGGSGACFRARLSRPVRESAPAVHRHLCLHRRNGRSADERRA